MGKINKEPVTPQIKRQQVKILHKAYKERGKI